MALQDIKIEFGNTFKGVMTTPQGTFPVGSNEGDLKPYNMLFGAIAACFYATFLSVAQKKRLEFDKAMVTVSGVQREELPTILTHVTLTLTVYGKDLKKDQLEKSAQMGATYCSIHKLVENTAHVELVVDFVE